MPFRQSLQKFPLFVRFRFPSINHSHIAEVKDSDFCLASDRDSVTVEEGDEDIAPGRSGRSRETRAVFGFFRRKKRRAKLGQQCARPFRGGEGRVGVLQQIRERCHPDLPCGKQRSPGWRQKDGGRVLERGCVSFRLEHESDRESLSFDRFEITHMKDIRGPKRRRRR